MSTNQELLQKADFALDDLQGSGKGGLLNAEQSNTFIRKLIKEPTMIREARTVTMRSHTMNINKIGFGKRILRKAVYGTALADAAVDGTFNASTEAAARAKPQTEQVQVTTNEVMAEVRIPYEVMEDNIERATAANNEATNTGPGGLRTTIIELIAERAALDMEEFGLLGDTGSSDVYLALQNGWLKNIETNGNVVDWNGKTVAKELFKAGVKAMPDQYLRNRAQLKNYISMDNEIEYRDTLANRGTGLGDQYTTGDLPARAYGGEVKAVSMMPEAKGLYVNPLNLIFGVHRDVSLEYEKSITERQYIIVLTARIGFQVEEAEATVLYKNIAEA